MWLSRLLKLKVQSSNLLFDILNVFTMVSISSQWFNQCFSSAIWNTQTEPQRIHVESFYDLQVREIE